MSERTRLNEDNIVETLVRDPLTQVTRKERVYLLAISLIGIAIVKTGLVPSKIATFGIELNQPDRQALLNLLAIVTVYFLIGFLVYAASDYVTRREIINLIKARMTNEQNNEEQETRSMLESSPEAPQLTADNDCKETLSVENKTQQVEPKRTKSSDRSLVGIIDMLSAEIAAFLARILVPFSQALENLSRSLVLVVGVPSGARELMSNDELEQLGASLSSRVVAGLRIIFEFLLPVLVGIYAIYTLLTASL